MASNVISELCVCHFKDVESSDITKFSDALWNKFLASFEHWKDLDGVQKEICQKIKVINPNWQNEHGYHRKCYQRFTDARSIARALKQSTKGTLKENFSDEPEDVLEFEPPAKRALRSVTGSSDMLNLIRRNKHILPPICIICRRQKRINRFGKRDYAKLISCEADCKKIIDAAKLKKDDAASTDSEESSSEYFEPQLHSTTGTGTYHLYYAAQDIRSMIEKCDSLKNWPPTAEDLTLNACKKVVPAGLFNFLAWCIGASNDICCDNFVNVACDVERKLLSLSQDIISVASKGRKLLPKQLALGMTL